MPQAQTNPAPIYRYDGNAYVRANAELVKNRQQLLRGMPRLSRVIRNDANLTAFLARQLVFETGRIEAQIFERLRAKEFIPIDTGHPRGADSYSVQMRNTEGEAKVSHDLAGDSPRVDVSVEEDLRKYANVRASYAYSVQELERAAMAGTPLPQWKGDACAEVIARELDKIGRVGHAALKLTGFFNNADVTLHTLTNGAWTGAATADQIVADLQEIEQTLISQTLDTVDLFGGYTLVLPTAMEGKLATTPRSTGSDLSIKEWFLRNARVIRSIERYSALDSATGDDVAAADPPQGICYPRDPAVLFWPMPITYEEQPPQLQGWEYVVDARARCGGVDFRRPTHCLYVENLD